MRRKGSGWTVLNVRKRYTNGTWTDMDTGFRESRFGYIPIWDNAVVHSYVYAPIERTIFLNNVLEESLDHTDYLIQGGQTEVYSTLITFDWDDIRNDLFWARDVNAKLFFERDHYGINDANVRLFYGTGNVRTYSFGFRPNEFVAATDTQWLRMDYGEGKWLDLSSEFCTGLVSGSITCLALIGDPELLMENNVRGKLSTLRLKIEYIN